MNKGNLRPRHT